jgi:hypothetical protein
MLWSIGPSMTPDIIDLLRSSQVSGRNRVRSRGLAAVLL